MSEMAEEKRLDERVAEEAAKLPKKEAAHDPAFEREKRTFDIAHWLGEAGSWVGSLAGAGVTYAATGNPYLAGGIGSTVGDYVGYEAGFTPYWYLKHTDRYKGLKGKGTFLKDWVKFNLKAWPIDLATYAVGIPLNLGLIYATGMNPILSTAITGAAQTLLYWLGYRTLNKGFLKNVAKEKNHAPKNPATENPGYLPAMPYAKPGANYAPH